VRVNFGVGTGRNQPIARMPGHAKKIEELGFDHITLIDSQNLARDVYVMLTIAALETRRIHIGHGVTNPFTRHWTVTANATSTLFELTGGRVFVGLGAGFSSMETLGLKPRPIAEVREAIQRMRALMAGDAVEAAGVTVRNEWSRNAVPIRYGADGVKSMKMAGGFADGAVSPAIHPEIIRWRLENIAKGAEAVDRDPGRCDLWTRTMCYIADSKEEAREQTRSYAATNATAFYVSVLSRDTPEAADLRKRIDAELVDDICRIGKAYDYYEHEKKDAPHGSLVTDRVLDAFILTGTADDVGEQIQLIADAGVTTVSMTDYTITDKLGMMEHFAKAVMPNFY
jgi:5,10-methylenetetrahydromethanopterin reductase